MEIVCIVCPQGCRIDVEGDKVTGHKCKRGIQFGIDETTAPMRVVTTTVATNFSSMPVLPVRTNGEVPKSKLWEIMSEINIFFLDKKVKMGETIIENIVGTGVDIIASASIE